MSTPAGLQMPSLSVIIPAKDRARELDATLAALAHGGQADEVIVVDDGSNDDTSSVAARHGARVVRHEVNRGAAAARNTGARQATSEVLLFIDSDVMVPAGLLDEVRRAFSDAATEALSGLLAKDSANPNFASQYDALYMHYQYRTHPPDFNVFYTSCAAIRREVFLRAEGFDEHYRGAGVEDMEFGQRLRRGGVRLRLHKVLEVTHAHPFGLPELLRKNARTAGGTLKIMLRNAVGGVRSERLVAPQWGFLAGIPLTWMALLLGLLALAWPPLLAVSLAMAVLVAALNRSFLGFLWRERGAGFFMKAVFFLFLNYLAYGLGIAAGALGFAAGSRY